MRRLWTSVWGAAATVMLLVAAADVGAETWNLELKRLGSSRRVTNPSEIFLRYTRPQSFFKQTGNVAIVSPTSSGEANFSEVVKKEPTRYESKYPFRGVAKLGIQEFAFVLDAAPSEKGASEDEEDADGEKDESPAAKLQHYTRLYFDVNHNGDLTDDPVIEAETPRQSNVTAARSYASYTFPTVDVTLEADGTEYEYAFSFNIYENAQQNFQYASASLSAAAYREGEITLDGETKRVVLVDFNSNGRFDDETAIDERVRTSDGSVYPSYGDMVYVDPDPSQVAYRYGYDVTTSDEQQFVSKLLNIEGRFYDAEISATGDKLTLSPTSLAVGYVTNPSKGYRAVVYNDKGFLKLSGDGSGKAPLPTGDWKLLSYTIDRTNVPEKEAAKPKEEPNSLLQVLVDAITPSAPVRSSQPTFTVVSARAKQDYPVVKVRAGETVSMPFGPPYKPVVTATHRQGASTASLALSIVGSGGELCNNLMVKGRRPPDPTFTITAAGEEVLSDKFEYG